MFDTNKYGIPSVSDNDDNFYIHAKELCNIFWLLADEVEKISPEKAEWLRKIADNIQGVGVYEILLSTIKDTGFYIFEEHKILEVTTPHGVLVSGGYDRITVEDTASGTHKIITAYSVDKNLIYHEAAKIEDVQYTEQKISQKLEVSDELMAMINKLDFE